MLHITRAIIVEGAYDRQRVNEVCDAFCFVTGGFNVFKNREKREFIRLLAREKGIIVLTDSDRAGFLIRNHIKNIVREGEVINAYIPEVFGKERRKDKPSAEGKLGVEGIERAALTEVLRPFSEGEGQSGEPVTKQDFFELGLSGSENSGELRRLLCKRLKIPVGISPNSLIDAVNAIMTKKQFYEIVNSIKL
ncbi:MAG: toprim domain-containing protein [Clostridia bacterium]